MTEEAGAPRLLLLGCGKMGAAMLARWNSSHAIGATVVVQPSRGNEARFPEQSFVADIASVDTAFTPDLLVVAIKPQRFDDVLPAVATRFPATPVLSIAAGKRLADHERLLGERAIVRAIPNLPVSLGQGATVCCANDAVDALLHERIGHLLAPLGIVAWLETEASIDIAVALVGSGPAYVYRLIEVLAEASARHGLPAEQAMQLARQTVIGSAALADAEPARSAAELRQAVTSPGGVTRAALDVLDHNDAFRGLFERALAANVARAAELARGESK